LTGRDFESDYSAAESAASWSSPEILFPAPENLPKL